METAPEASRADASRQPADKAQVTATTGSRHPNHCLTYCITCCITYCLTHRPHRRSLPRTPRGGWSSPKTPKWLSGAPRRATRQLQRCWCWASNRAASSMRTPQAHAAMVARYRTRVARRACITRPRTRTRPNLIKVDLQANAFSFNPRRRQAQRNRAHARVHPMALIPHRVMRMRLKGQSPSGVSVSAA